MNLSLSRPIALATACLALLGALSMILLGASRASAATAWLSPASLSEAGQNAEQPQIAVDAAGDAIAVWSRTDGTHFIVEAATRPVGGLFSAPVKLSAPGQDAKSPQVAVNAKGDAVAVWRRTDGTHFIVEAAARPAGGSFSAPVKLSDASQDAFEPQIAIDAKGNAIALWTRFDAASAHFIVEAAARPAGGSFSILPPPAPPGGDATSPQIAFDANGNATALWTRFDNTFHAIAEAATRPAAGGAFGPAVQLSNSSQSAFEPKLGVDASGDAIAAWRRSDTEHVIVEAATRPAGGAFAAPVKLSQPGQDALELRLGVSPGGAAVALWTRTDGVSQIVEAATRPAGGVFSAPAKLSEAGQDAGSSQVALDAKGDAIAVWTRRSDGPRTLVEAATRPAGGAFSAPAKLSELGRNATSPQIGIDAEGDAIAAWQRSDGAHFIVQAAIHDATPPQLRSLAIPTTGVAGKPISFAVSPFDFSSQEVDTLWSFGDGGKPAPGAKVTHTYAAPGAYKLTLTATDGSGNAASNTATIRVAPANPKAIADRIAKLRGKKAILKLSCPVSGPCNGTVKLSVKKVTLGKRSFQIGAGKRISLAIRLTARGRRLIKAAGRRKVSAKLGGPGVEPAKVRLKR